MRLLLDTHVFLWYLSANPRIPDRARAAVQDPTNDVFLSAASVWEAVIKYYLGKLSLPAPAEQYLLRGRERHGISTLPVDEGAMVHLVSLPPLHRDPFDRMIVAQALQFGMTIVTVDPVVSSYPASILPTS